MKSFLTIRGNLLLVNLVVIGLILWLAVSFLFIAVIQRQDALNLQSNVDIEREILHTNTQLAHERDAFDDLQNALMKPADEVSYRLNEVGQKSDTQLDKLVAQIVEQTAKVEVFEHMPTTEPLLQTQLVDLSRSRSLLAEFRGKTLEQYQLPIELRDPVVLFALFTQQTDIMEKVVELSKSLKYLPDAKPSSISQYQDLLNEILVFNVELARKRNTLNRISSGGRSPTIDEFLQILVLDQKIEYRLIDIVNRSKASDNSAELVTIANEVWQFYQEYYVLAGKSAFNYDSSQTLSEETLNEWRLIMSTVSTMTGELAEATLTAIETLGNDHGNRAQRNFIIDVILVFLCFAITIASIAINRKMKRYAFHDTLTQLPNRLSFESALENGAVSGSKMQAVIFLDLDKFKSINDSYGHAIGDELLLEVAKRLNEICGSTDTLARMGGDEFAVFIDNVQSESSVETLASEMIETIKSDIKIRGLSLHVGASAGISVSPVDCECGTELIKNADIAMYHSKANKLNEVYRFNQNIADSYHKRLQLEADLRKAADKNEFQLVYQPKVCTQTGQVKSVEALLRWYHAERGFISPAQFIPVAEDIGLMSTIGKWVLNEACCDIALLHKKSMHEVQVAVNISAQQFSDSGFVDSVYDALDQHGLERKSLELEVTESIVMTDVERVIKMLTQLKQSGVAVAIDDFGTGYSSLQYLQELPLDTLKIDRAFVLALDENDPTSSVANSIVQLAKLFNLETVAEGVETDDQVKKIKSLGVHHIQGYFYSKPISARDLPDAIQMIAQQNNKPNDDTEQRAAA